MESEVTKFKCYDCCVESRKEKLLTKTVTELRKEYSNWVELKTTYECNLGLSDCRNLKTFENSDIVASHRKKMEKKEREDYSRPNKRVR